MLRLPGPTRRILGRENATPVLVVLAALVGLLPFATSKRGAAAAADSAEKSVETDATSLAGQVLDSDGKPVGGAFVFATRYRRDSTLEIVGRATSTDAGTFSLKLPMPATQPSAGRTQVFATLPHAGFSDANSLNAETPIQLRLQPSAELHLPFVGPDDKPIVGLRVWPKTILFRDDSTPFPKALELPDEVARLWATRTDAQGVCIFRGLPRSARVRFDDDDDRFVEMNYADIVPLERQGVIQATPIHLKSAATISGSVVYSDSGKPASGLAIFAQSVTHGGGGMGKTDASGHYQIRRLKPSRYVVTIDRNQDEPTDWTTHAALADVAEGEHATSDMVLIHGGLITGIVRAQDSGKGIAGLHVALHGPAAPASAGGVQAAITDSHGVYRLRVPPGIQSIYLMEQPPEGYLRPDANPTHLQEIVVRDGQTVTYNLDLPVDKSPAVTGIVLDPDGKPAANATVLFYPDDEDNAMQRAVSTGADGRFRMSRVPGNGKFRARRGDMATLSAVPCPSGDNHELVLRLSRDALFGVLVRVTDSHGKPVPGAAVQLITTYARQGTGSPPHPTEDDGTVHFDTLFTDINYDVSATVTGGSTEIQAVRPPESGKPGQQVVELKIRSADSSISGVVVDEKQNLVPGAEVWFSGPGAGMQKTQTDAMGRFKFALISGTHGYLYLPAMKRDLGMRTAASASAGDSDLRLLLVSIPKSQAKAHATQPMR